MAAVKSGIMSILRTIDSMVLNLWESGEDLKTALHYKDAPGIVQGAGEHSRAYLTGVKYATSLTDKGLVFTALVAEYFSIDEIPQNLVQATAHTQVLAGLGIAFSSLGVIVNAISIYRQN